MKEVSRIWGSRGLTPAGRIQIFKSIVLSKMVYISTMLHPSKQSLDQLNLIQKDFIWRGHHPKIKHSTMIGNYTNGGYKDVDIESKFESLKINWIRCLQQYHPYVHCAVWNQKMSYIYSAIALRLKVFGSLLEKG